MQTPIVVLVVAAALPVAFAQDSKAVKAGQEVFGANCQMCHNPDSNEALIGPGLAGIKSGKMPKSGEEVTEKSLMKIIDKFAKTQCFRMQRVQGLPGQSTNPVLDSFDLTAKY